ncbi:MAG: hypothetical protein SCARUB_00546 [Candidatus Scalindua rubra]|uniref:Uncharacterized protein n=1 Tax=Candidatus Scalindua rubra TaxID=1872076 RepID=A0A1E3XF76_9BACT|nr:MAG: hypothetical protein SCARUB_00546 [Candidatus Scalindua rubra]
MIGKEQQVLKIIRELKRADEETLGRKMAISSNYATEICKGLVKDGYILKTPKGYVITKEGEKISSPVKVRGPIAVLKGGL